MFEVPEIAPVAPEIHRPFWSVMVPSCGRSPFLRRTLESILANAAAAPEDFQIAVLDNTPPGTTGNIAEIVETLSDKIEIHRNAGFVGMAENWNHCLEKSRGHYVQILHDDDFLADNYHARMRELIETAPPEYGIFGCSTAYVDPDDRVGGVWRYPGFLYRGRATIADFALENYFCAPSVTVRRECYERLGGFVEHFRFSADWEMWCRIIRFYRAAALDEPLAFYRWHGANATLKIQESGDDVTEALEVLDELHRDGVKFRWRLARLSRVRYAMINGGRFHAAGKIEAAERCRKIVVDNSGFFGRMLISSGFFVALRYWRRLGARLADFFHRGGRR